MNRTLYFRLLYYLMGTFIVVAVFSVVILNIVRDSRLFARNGRGVSDGQPGLTEIVENTNRIIAWQRTADITPALQTLPPAATTAVATYRTTAFRATGTTERTGLTFSPVPGTGSGGAATPTPAETPEPTPMPTPGPTMEPASEQAGHREYRGICV